MTKAELVEFIAEKADLTKADAGRALEAMIEGIADVTLAMPGGYKVLDREEIVQILRESLV